MSPPKAREKGGYGNARSRLQATPATDMLAFIYLYGWVLGALGSRIPISGAPPPPSPRPAATPSRRTRARNDFGSILWSFGAHVLF